MSTLDASTLLRSGLLDGVSILLARAPAGPREGASFGDAVRDACAGLGALVRECDVSADPLSSEAGGATEQAVEAAVERASADGAGVDFMAVDCASVFTRAVQHDGDAREALRLCLDSSWNATRALVNAAFLPDSHGGRIVYLAPPADAGEHADAARAGLENLARTLSIEWARHGITAVAIAPGAAHGGGDGAGEVAALTAYLAAPAGAYFSGCLLDLSGADQPDASGASRRRSRDP